MFVFAMNVGCQTSELNSWNELHPGMDKGDVLEIMGSPKASLRFHGKDRWLYRFYDQSQRYDKEVHFQDGVAVYLGDERPVPLEQSAAYIDAKNEDDNARDREDSVNERKKFLEDYAAWEAAGGIPSQKPIDPALRNSGETSEKNGIDGAQPQGNK